jgi:hypothetical protein
MDILFLIFGLLAAGLYKKDFTTLFLSGAGFIFYGLSIVKQPELLSYGVISVAYGLYLMLRTSVDLISYKKKDVKND